jgi:hypothetical protein
MPALIDLIRGRTLILAVAMACALESAFGAEVPLDAQRTALRLYVETGYVSAYCVSIDGKIPSVEVIRQLPAHVTVGHCPVALHLSNYRLVNSEWAQLHVEIRHTMTRHGGEIFLQHTEEGELFLQRTAIEGAFAYSCCWGTH